MKCALPSLLPTLCSARPLIFRPRVNERKRDIVLMQLRYQKNGFRNVLDIRAVYVQNAGWGI